MSRLDFVHAGAAVILLAAPGTLHAGAGASPVAVPRPTRLSYYYDAFDQSFARPIARSTDLARLTRALSGHRREAANVDEHDQVLLPSTWWQPRLGFRRVTVDQMMRGPGPEGPVPGRLVITRLKTQGVSPGFTVKDAAGNRFAIKFDPPDWPEMATGADVVTSYLFWAAGYNVPQNSIVYLSREDLDIDPGAKAQDARGREHALTPAMLQHVLARAHAEPDGRYRAVASRWIPGVRLGEWLYRGRRADDPEDLVPHELRREIRGLWTLYAWTNDTDCSARNTYDTWIPGEGRSFVRHYLIDFSGALGSASIAPQTYSAGFEHLMDFGVAGASLATLGLRPRAWERVVDPGLRSVGFIESRQFEPDAWKPFLPNPAFDERTERDVRWGARIVAGFTDEHIRAAVAAGKYSDPRAADYLARVLIERRDKIARRWLGIERRAESRAAE